MLARRCVPEIVGVAVLVIFSSRALCQEQPPGVDPKLPQVIVTPPAAKPAKKPHAVKKKAEPSAKLSPSQPPPVAISPLGGGNLPGRADLSPTAAALPAASTTIDQGRMERAPVTSYGDIFRALPGFNVANYGQGALGYGLSMRGYTDAEHGRDIAYFIDGIPVNEISSIHTPNYADLNILIPETVQGIEVVRGPFSVEAGDSNLGGAIFITTKSSDPYAGLNLSGGSWGTGRGLATYGSNTGSFEPYLAAEIYHTDGYRDNSELDRYNVFDKITVPLGAGDTLTFRAQAYGTDSGAPGYLNRNALQSGLVSATAAVDPTDGVSKTMQNFTVNYTSGPAAQQFTAMSYVSHDIFTRYADFCESLPGSPTAPCQSVQNEERESVGGKLRKVWTSEVADIPVQVLSGVSWRTDFIDDFAAPTTSRRISGPATVDMTTTETDLAAFAQLQLKPFSWLKLTGGGRFDQFFYEIDNRLNPAIEPDITPGIWSPKAGAAVTPVKWLELYVNYGQGFRSPDAVTELVANYPQRVQPFKIESEEVGGKIQSGGLTVQAALYRTDAENEAFQPAPGLPVTLLGATRREGYDLDARYSVFKDRGSEIALFGNYGAVDAFRLDEPRTYVPNVPDYTANLGVDFNVAAGGSGERLLGQAYVSFIGRKCLTEDCELTTSSFQRVSAKVAYAWTSGWSAFTQATWYPDNRYSEAAFDFGNAVHASSSDIYVGPVPEFTILTGFTYRMPISKPLLPDGFKE